MRIEDWIAISYRINLKKTKENSRKIVLTFIEPVFDSLMFSKNRILESGFWTWKEKTGYYYLTFFFKANKEIRNQIKTILDNVRISITDIEIDQGDFDIKALKEISSLTEESINSMVNNIKKGIEEWRNPRDTSPF